MFLLPKVRRKVLSERSSTLLLLSFVWVFKSINYCTLSLSL